MKPLISVIIPVYKVEEYLDRCVESVVNQTYENLEIILVDDGSPDNCPAMCDVWAQKDSRIKVIHKENEGAAAARNIALDNARGDYISFIDSDDYIEQDMFEIMLESIDRNSADIAVCEHREYEENGETAKIYKIDFDRDVVSAEDCLTNIYGSYFSHTVLWNKLYKRFVWNDIRFPNIRKFEDEAVLPLIYDKAKRISIVRKALYNQVKSSGSIMRSDFSESDMLIFNIFDESMAHFLQIGNKKVYNSILLHKLSCIRGTYFHAYHSKNPINKNIKKKLVSEYRKNFNISVKSRAKYSSLKELFKNLFFYVTPDLYVFYVERM